MSTSASRSGLAHDGRADRGHCHALAIQPQMFQQFLPADRNRVTGETVQGVALGSGGVGAASPRSALTCAPSALRRHPGRHRAGGCSGGGCTEARRLEAVSWAGLVQSDWRPREKRSGHRHPQRAPERGHRDRTPVHSQGARLPRPRQHPVSGSRLRPETPVPAGRAAWSVQTGTAAYRQREAALPRAPSAAVNGVTRGPREGLGG